MKGGGNILFYARHMLEHKNAQKGSSSRVASLRPRVPRTRRAMATKASRFTITPSNPNENCCATLAGLRQVQLQTFLMRPSESLRCTPVASACIRERLAASDTDVPQL